MGIPAAVDGLPIAFVRPIPPDTKTMYLVRGSTTSVVSGKPLAITELLSLTTQVSATAPVPGVPPVSPETAVVAPAPAVPPLIAPPATSTITKVDGSFVILAGAQLILSSGHIGVALPAITAGTVIQVT